MALVLAVLAAGCSDGRVRLRHGALGPASYAVELGVGGEPAVRTSERARMRVDRTARGASLTLEVPQQAPVVVELVRNDDGQLVLDTVQGISPTSAGEADLAAVVSQLDPPLPSGRVGLGDTWTRTRTLATETIDARLTSRLRAVRFRRVGGTDALEIAGTVRGTMRTSGQTGDFEGTVTGETTIQWALKQGRLAASSTRLVWSIRDAGRLVVDTVVTPG